MNQEGTEFQGGVDLGLVLRAVANLVVLLCVLWCGVHRR